jgi:two-component system KDP operon response regulator KdpE
MLILIIEDEAQIRRALRNAIQAEQLGEVIEASTGREGIDLAATRHPDLVVLDHGLPDLPGDSVCAEIRGWADIPIVVLSARHSEAEKVRLLDAGADDYVTKPFGTAELQARLRVQLRRAQRGDAAASTLTQVDGLSIDLGRRALSMHGREIHLTPTEWDLLRALVRSAGRILTHKQLFAAVWGKPAGDPQANLRVHLGNLRRKIEPEPLQPRFILTEPGVGYRFRALD